MRVKIVEDNGIISLLTDKVNGIRFTVELAVKMFDYRDNGYGIRVPSKDVLHKLNNFAVACYRLPIIHDVAVIPASKLLK